MKKLALCLLLFGAPSAALSAVYECTATNKGTGGWIGDKIYVEINKEGTKAEAVDAVINSVHGKPIPVEIKKTKDSTYQLTWRLRNVKISNQGSGILTQTFTIDTSTRKFRMRGRLHGYDNNISASGTCKPV